MNIDVNVEIEKQAYDLVTEFLNDINLDRKENLAKKYDINQEIYEEINEILDIPFERPFEFSIIEFDKIYHAKNMAIFEIFKMNNPDELGVECAVYNNKKITDMTLEGRLFIEDNKLCFMYILFKF